MVFSRLVVTKNIAYISSTSKKNRTKQYRVDVYEPAEDSSVLRPLIIWMHGGAFKFGSKRSEGTVLWCETFAKRGYICAAINYRTSKKRPLFKTQSFFTGCYEAVQDLNAAINFFKQNASQFRIDTNKIILAGNSAGGMIAVQYCYADIYSFKTLTKSKDIDVSEDIVRDTNIRAVVNFWGAIFDRSWLGAGETPIVSVHGRNDKLVPLGTSKRRLYGSNEIHKRANALNIPNSLKVYPRQGHELRKFFLPGTAGRSAKRRWLEAGQFAADFLFEEIFAKAASRGFIKMAVAGQ